MAAAAATDDVEYDNEMIDEFEHLLTILQKVMTTGQGSKPILSPVLKCLNKYIRVFKEVKRKKPEAVLDEVDSCHRSAYAIHRKAILDGSRNDTWLRNDAIIIYFGGTKTAMTEDVKIQLGFIYTKAIELCAAIPEDEKKEQEELNYPDIIILHLYRIFRGRAPGSDYAKLSEIIKQLESDLGIAVGTTPDMGLGAIDFGAMLSNVASNVTSSLREQGLTTDDNHLDIGRVVNNIINSDAAKQVAGNVKNVMNTGKSGEDLTKGLVDAVLSRESTSHIAKAVSDSMKVAGMSDEKAPARPAPISMAASASPSSASMAASASLSPAASMAASASLSSASVAASASLSPAPATAAPRPFISEERADGSVEVDLP